MRLLRKVLLCLFILGLVCAQLTPALAEAKKVDPTGTWKWERTFGDTTVKFTLRLKLEEKKVSGTYASLRNGTTSEVKIEDAKMEEDQLSFRVDREFNDRKFTINLKGKVGEDTIEGGGEFSSDGDSRKFDWEANRFVGNAEVLGTWKFRIETQNGTILEPTLKLTEKDGKLQGAYSSQERDFEATKVEVKKNQLAFNIAGENDGNSWNVTYKGKPRGNSIKGTIDYDFAGNRGTIEFSGKLTPEKKKEPTSK